MIWKIFARQPGTWDNPEDYARECYRSKVIAVGWSEVGDLNRINSRKELVRRLRSRWREDARTIGQNAGALWNFRNEVKPGHIVICPDRDSRQYYVGRVVSNKAFHDKSLLGGRCSFAHRRKVKWFRPLHPAEVASIWPDGRFGGNQTVSRINGGADRLIKFIRQARKKFVPRPRLASRPDIEWGRAAEERAMTWLKQRGYKPWNVTHLNIGWDIECGEDKFEVKGRKTEAAAIRLTHNEWRAACQLKLRYTLLVFTAPTLDRLKRVRPVQIPDPTRTQSWARRVTYEYVLAE